MKSGGNRSDRRFEPRHARTRMMIGRELAASLEEHANTAVGEELLRVENLASPGKFSEVSFTLRAGEVYRHRTCRLWSGAGRTEISEALFGLDREATGDVYVRGKKVSFNGPDPGDARSGLGLGTRKTGSTTVWFSRSRPRRMCPCRFSTKLPSWDGLSLKKNEPSPRSFSTGCGSKPPASISKTAGLSGGNQQKLVLAKWLAADTDVLLVDEPTRGVDVGAKAEIHNLIRGLAAEGNGVLLISSDLPELLSLATRLIVMREGDMVGELPANPGEESVMRLMAGVK